MRPARSGTSASDLNTNRRRVVPPPCGEGQGGGLYEKPRGWRGGRLHPPAPDSFSFEGGRQEGEELGSFRRPFRSAQRAAWVRSLTPRRWNALPRWVLTVFSLIPSRAAICLLASPLA